ncbi:MAG TPA: citrate transporter [Anaerolineae bacterium]|nr:citrate transporter [Anaerolineae bacterium]
MAMGGAAPQRAGCRPATGGDRERSSGETEMNAWKVSVPKTLTRWLVVALSGLLLGVWLLYPWAAEAQHQAEGEGPTLSGRVVDSLGEPIHDADIALVTPDGQALAHTASQRDGTFQLHLPPDAAAAATLTISRPHFETLERPLSPDQTAQLDACGAVHLGDLTLSRRITPGFWVATLAFALVLLLIALEKLHKTTAALLGAALILGVSFVGGALTPSLFIFDFEQALDYVDFDVIFLVMGMMIVIGVIEETGIFQWLAYQAYRLSQGKLWLLVVILIALTAVASALLDNVTTMLLMAPITIQIALTLGLNPLTLLIPEVLASNVGGISTLIGTPTNILIGSYAKLGFNDFLINQTPGVVAALIALSLYVILRYRKEYAAAGSRLSAAMQDRLRESGRITEPDVLRKAGIIFGLMLIFFVIGDAIHLVPAVTAIIGAVAMLLWVAPDIEEMLKVVDWTTLMFFIALFIGVGALQEVGLISLIAQSIGNLVGDNLTLAVLILVWSAALLSGIIDNIPFAAAMLPVVAYLTRTIPGAESGVLWYALSIGAAMGGNSTLIGASPNLVTAGIAERAGYRITYLNFLRIGFPATILTVAVGTIWLFIRF